MRVRLPLSATVPTPGIALLLLALGAIGCRPAEREAAGFPAARSVAETGAPGLVLVCIDTLRADAIVTERGVPEWMPALDAFARGATVFRDATSSSSWTAPSVATLLTGLECSETGVHGAVAAGALTGSLTTLAEALHERGYSTAAATSGGWVVPERGYGQGFDSFSRDFDGTGPETVIANWQAHRAKDAPFFLFLHTTTAHDPYGPKDPQWLADPLPDVVVRGREVVRATAAAGWKLTPQSGAWFLEKYLFDGRARVSLGKVADNDVLGRLFDLSMEWLDGEGRGTADLDAVVKRAPAAYREGLSVADDVFARTLAALDALGLPKGTVIAVVGDHGEALGEHGTLSHGRFLYDEMVRVPLVVRAPGRLPKGLVVDGSCGLVDVMATFLDLARAPARTGSGRSLVPLALGGEEGHPVFAQEDRVVVDAGHRRTLRVLSVRTEAAKLLVTYDLRSLEVEKTEIYDLVADPRESTPIRENDAGRFGADFCRAAARLRSSIPGASAEPSCGAATR